jgi:hypothetical protein
LEVAVDSVPLDAAVADASDSESDDGALAAGDDSYIAALAKAYGKVTLPEPGERAFFRG